MLNPNSLKAKPADNYDDLKKQFFALKNICESKIKQCSIYSKKLAEYDRESLIARNEAIESEKEMNAQLTEELEKANERVAELEKQRDYNQRMYNSLLGDLSAGYGELSISECEKHLNKFAIEKKVEGVNWFSEKYCDDEHSFLADKAIEQLRKEQE